MKPTLLILAAGMGSRYGGLKQLDPFGPNGETIMDYSVFDAIRTGFGKVVFVIRHDFEDEFREKILSRYAGKIDTDVAFQENPTGREKPWGVTHAIISAADIIKEPFFMINADDFYGLDAFEKAAEFLTDRKTTGEYCIIGYRLDKVLSDAGGVNRGICTLDFDGNITDIEENNETRREGGIIKSKQREFIADDAPVSMNAICFTADFMTEASKYFNETFLPENRDDEKIELNAPMILDYLKKNNIANTKCIMTTAEWFGVTYKEDRPETMEKLAALHADGTYPNKLF